MSSSAISHSTRREASGADAPDSTVAAPTPPSAHDAPVSADPEVLRAHVRDRYGEIAARVLEIESESGVTSDLYGTREVQALPVAAVLASLGCGNPTALAELRPGEVVLDLGSGGGIDVLLSAQRVGPTGFVFGLDMTDEMLALANANKLKAGAKNVTFLKGTIEAIPLPANSVDVVISNCVINLSADKDAVLREAFRVLKPGGRFAVSDVVALRHLPASVRESMDAWTGCVSGALHRSDYLAKLAGAGFEGSEIEITRTFSATDVAQAAGDTCCAPPTLPSDEPAESCCGPRGGASPDELRAAGDAVASAFIRATKPA